MDKRCEKENCSAPMYGTSNGYLLCKAHYEESVEFHLSQLTTPTLYIILPLEWKKTEHGTVYVKTPVGRYSIFLIKGIYKWEYISYSDVNQAPNMTAWGFPTSIEDGKAQAEAHYREQIGKCLEVHNG